MKNSKLKNFEGDAIIRQEEDDVYIVDLYHPIDCVLLARMRVKLIDFVVSEDFMRGMAEGKTQMEKCTMDYVYA